MGRSARPQKALFLPACHENRTDVRAIEHAADEQSPSNSSHVALPSQFWTACFLVLLLLAVVAVAGALQVAVKDKHAKKGQKARNPHEVFSGCLRMSLERRA